MRAATSASVGSLPSLVPMMSTQLAACSWRASVGVTQIFVPGL